MKKVISLIFLSFLMNLSIADEVNENKKTILKQIQILQKKYDNGLEPPHKYNNVDISDTELDRNNFIVESSNRGDILVVGIKLKNCFTEISKYQNFSNELGKLEKVECEDGYLKFYIK